MYYEIRVPDGSVPFSAELPKGRGNHPFQFPERRGLADITVGTKPAENGRASRVVGRRIDDNRDVPVPVIAPDAFQAFLAAHNRHVQVEENDVGKISGKLFEPFDSLRTVLRVFEFDQKIKGLDGLLEEHTVILVVIDKEYMDCFCFHGRS